MQERQQQASGPSGGGSFRPAALGPTTITISDNDVLVSSSSTNFSYNFALTSTRPQTPKRPGQGSRPATAGANGADTFGYGIALSGPFQESEPLLRRLSPPPPAAAAAPPAPPTEQPFPSSASASGLRKNNPGRKSSLGAFSSSAPPHAQQSTFSGLRRRAKSSSALRDRDGLGEVQGIGSRPRNTSSRTPPAVAKSPLETTVKASPPAPIPHNHAPTPAAELSRNTDSASSSSYHHSASRPTGLGSRAMDPTAAFIPGGGRMLSRTGTNPANGFPLATSGGMMLPPPSAGALQGESSMVHQHIQEMANKRISTLEYLRKAHEGRVYWFNTVLFDKPDLARMPYFDNRRLARRATNYLLLGLSLPTVIDLNSNTPMEFLRTFNLLLSEFDSFQSLHPETGGPSSALGRARIPNLNVFRRATPSAKARRSSSANNEILYEDGMTAAAMNGVVPGSAGVPGVSSAAGSATSVMNGLGGSASVVSFGQSEADLLPGEEYVHLLTPSLPFDPDFFETFATLCDVLIDAYTRLLSLLPTPRECNAAVAELFTKADSRVRKIIVQGVVKEFEETSRNGVRTEVANVGKIVLGGLM